MKITSSENNFQLYHPELRKPKGWGISPYSLWGTIRCMINNIFNGFFSYISPDRQKMQLLGKEGRITKGLPASTSQTSLKIIFLGDIMVSRSGKPPELDSHLKTLLANAGVIIANVESPVVQEEQTTKRGFSLNFKMNSSYLSSLQACNRTAKWVFSIANNHACDTSRKDSRDVSGIKATIQNIRSAIPSAEIIGSTLDAAKSVLSLQVRDGPKLGVVGWTEVMNRDNLHHQKEIVRETDLTESTVEEVKAQHDFVIGFAHGNEEQSYYPLKDTRDRWIKLLGEKKFDMIVGHGPHVVQPAEQINQSLLFHSIGNFCSPVGRSQTKVGCIPEITLHYTQKAISSIQYQVHHTEQQNESVALLQEGRVLYSNITQRLKKIWKTL